MFSAAPSQDSIASHKLATWDCTSQEYTSSFWGEGTPGDLQLTDNHGPSGTSELGKLVETTLERPHSMLATFTTTENAWPLVTNCEHRIVKFK